MGVAFRAPRAPIERPKPPSSRFSFYRRKNTVVIIEYVFVYTIAILILSLIVFERASRRLSRRLGLVIVYIANLNRYFLLLFFIYLERYYVDKTKTDSKVA